jgi:hypothetical protein
MNLGKNKKEKIVETEENRRKQKKNNINRRKQTANNKNTNIIFVFLR